MYIGFANTQALSDTPRPTALTANPPPYSNNSVRPLYGVLFTIEYYMYQLASCIEFQLYHQLLQKQQ